MGSELSTLSDTTLEKRSLPVVSSSFLLPLCRLEIEKQRYFTSLEDTDEFWGGNGAPVSSAATLPTTQ